MIEFQHAGVQFGETTVLSEINLTLRAPRTGIIGANGEGKTTLLRTINGLGELTTGKVLVNGLNPATDGKLVRQQTGYIFQDVDAQIIMPQVRQDIAFSLRRLRLPPAEIAERVDAMLQRFGLAEFADASPNTLSGGQKQLLALASILIMQPQLILADEPTALLDLRNQLRIRRIFAELTPQLVVVSHDLELLQDFDEVIWIAHGKVAAQGDPASVIREYRTAMYRENNN